MKLKKAPPSAGLFIKQKDLNVPKNTAAPADKKQKQVRVSQTDVPGYSLEQALRIPKAMIENYAGQATPPLRVASAMGVQPASSSFRQLCGAAIAYELTEGGSKAPEIKLTSLAKRILRPTIDGDDIQAKREALLKPRVVREFLEKYNGNMLPKDNIAQNVLNDFGVPTERTSEILALIIEGAESLGLITEIKGKQYVDLNRAITSSSLDSDLFDQGALEDSKPTEEKLVQVARAPDIAIELDLEKKRKVFITHGKNQEFVAPIKKLLAFGEMEAVVSVEKQSISQPVPDKVMNDMRACGAAIIHVEDELKLLDKDANEQIVLNPNVLIEIGAAMALYKKRFILLVKEGVKLPSNLQGLFEVRYSGTSLDGNATIRLLEAINEMKKTD